MFCKTHGKTFLPESFFHNVTKKPKEVNLQLENFSFQKILTSI